jgi:methyltransferase-like protein 6
VLDAASTRAKRFVLTFWRRVLQKQPLYDEARVAASVCDITNDPLPDAAFANGGVDFALFLFCLSALHPDKMQDAVKKVVAAIKPGGKLFFRDYGRYDQAQLRFRAGCKLQENFYVRQDNTRTSTFGASTPTGNRTLFASGSGCTLSSRSP